VTPAATEVYIAEVIGDLATQTVSAHQAAQQIASMTVTTQAMVAQGQQQIAEAQKEAAAALQELLNETKYQTQNMANIIRSILQEI
jgi:hypothetical protein